MRLSSFETELAVIKTICDTKNEALQSFLLGRLNADYFGYPPAKEVYNRIAILLKNDKDIPRLRVFREDLALSKEARIAIKGKIKELKKKRAQDSLDILKRFHKVRLVYQGIEKISGNFSAADSGKKFLIDNAVDELEDIVRKSREGADAAELVHAGKGSTGQKLVNKILSSKVPNLIPTGFGGFDSKNGGLPKCGVVILASNTGGGKTVMGIQLLRNMYLHANQSTCLSSFEMNKEEMYGRLLSNVARVPHDAILQRTMSRKQKKSIRRAFKKFDKHGKKKKIRWSLYVPTEDVSFMELMYRLKPYGYKVHLVDYINLLKQNEGENQAQSLGEITRQAKQWSRKTKSLIIILAQMTDDDRVKYSRAITENADNVWLWRYGEKERETHIIDIQQDKARNQKVFPFSLFESYDIMTLNDSKEEGGSKKKESMKDLIEKDN